MPLAPRNCIKSDAVLDASPCLFTGKNTRRGRNGWSQAQFTHSLHLYLILHHQSRVPALSLTVSAVRVGPAPPPESRPRPLPTPQSPSPPLSPLLLMVMLLLL